MNLPEFLIGYATFAMILLGLVATGVIPRTRWGMRRSANGLGRVHMHAPDYYVQTGQSALGVLAQERTECLLKWAMFLTVIGAFVSKTRWFFRQLEFIGHAAEIVVAAREGFDRDQYLHAEAARTYRSAAYGGAFDHLDLDGMKRALRRRFWIAGALVAVQTGIRMP